MSMRMLVPYAGEKGTWLDLFCFFGVVGLSEGQNLFRKKQCCNLLLLWGGLCGKESIGADLHLSKKSKHGAAPTPPAVAPVLLLGLHKPRSTRAFSL